MSLKRLYIRDYQCHETLGIEFDPGVTTLVGASDVGKSAVLRAIRWAMFNRPLGDACIREGAEKSVVKLLVDGQTIRRRRGKGQNIYELDKKRYEAFGNNVPEPVQNLLNLSEVNVQGQHDPAFWFSLSSPEVARQLNQVVDLDVMDAVVSCVASRVRTTSTERDVTMKRLKAAEEELEGMSYVPGMEKSLEKLEALEEDCITAESEPLALSELLESIRGAKANMVEVPDLSKLKELADELEEAEAVYGPLSILLEDISTKRGELQRSALALVKAKQELEEEFGDVCPLCGSEIERGLLWVKS